MAVSSNDAEDTPSSVVVVVVVVVVLVDFGRGFIVFFRRRLLSRLFLSRSRPRDKLQDFQAPPAQSGN